MVSADGALNDRRNRPEAPGADRVALGLLKVRVEPGYGAADAVAAMFWLHEHVAFVFVDYTLRFDAQSF